MCAYRFCKPPKRGESCGPLPPGSDDPFDHRAPTCFVGNSGAGAHRPAGLFASVVSVSLMCPTEHAAWFHYLQTVNGSLRGWTQCTSALTRACASTELVPADGGGQQTFSSQLLPAGMLASRPFWRPRCPFADPDSTTMMLLAAWGTDDRPGALPQRRGTRRRGRTSCSAKATGRRLPPCGPPSPRCTLRSRSLRPPR
jgi:hypothetical protein